MRLGIKWFDGKVYDILYVSESKDGVVIGAPNDDRHVTIVNDVSRLSSHLTLPEKQKRRPIASINKDDLASGDDAAREFFRLKPTPSERLDHKIFYLTQKWVDAIDFINVSQIEENHGNYSRVYYDMPAVMKRLKELVAEIERNPKEYWGICLVRDLLVEEGRIGLLEDNRIMLRSGNELVEIDFPLSYPLKSDNKRLNDVINFTGIYLIKDGVEKLIDEIGKNARIL